MAGLIASRQAANPAVLSPDALMNHMKLNPQQKQQIQRIVIAGMKVMFSPQTHHLMLQTLQGTGPIAQKLGQGVSGLMGLLLQESKGAIPPQLVLPAGMILLAHAVEFLTKAGQPVSPQDFAAATKILISTLLQGAKVDPNKVMANAQATAAGGGVGAPAAPQQPAGMPPGAPR